METIILTIWYIIGANLLLWAFKPDLINGLFGIYRWVLFFVLMVFLFPVSLVFHKSKDWFYDTKKPIPWYGYFYTLPLLIIMRPFEWLWDFTEKLGE